MSQVVQCHQGEVVVRGDGPSAGCLEPTATRVGLPQVVVSVAEHEIRPPTPFTRGRQLCQQEAGYRNRARLVRLRRPGMDDPAYVHCVGPHENAATEEIQVLDPKSGGFTPAQTRVRKEAHKGPVLAAFVGKRFDLR